MTTRDPDRQTAASARTARVDGAAVVGSSSTRPSPRSETDLDAQALDQILDELIDYAGWLLDEAGFPPLHVELTMGVGHLP